MTIDEPKPATEVDTEHCLKLASSLANVFPPSRPGLDTAEVILVHDVGYAMHAMAEEIERLRQYQPTLQQARKDMRRTVDVLTTTADALAHEVLHKHHRSQQRQSTTSMFSALANVAGVMEEINSIRERAADRERARRESEAPAEQDAIAESPAAQQ